MFNLKQYSKDAYKSAIKQKVSEKLYEKLKSIDLVLPGYDSKLPNIELDQREGMKYSGLDKYIKDNIGIESCILFISLIINFILLDAEYTRTNI